jgi:DNA ligase-1
MSTKPLAQQVVTGTEGAESATGSRRTARPRESLFHLCATADTIRQTPRRDDKRALLEPYFGALDANTIGSAVRILAGALFTSAKPGAPETTSAETDTSDAGPIPTPVSRTLAVTAIRALTRVSAERLLDLTMKLGDLGDVAGEVFSGRLPSGVSVREAEDQLRGVVTAADSDTVRLPLVRDVLAKLSGIEAQYVVRLLCGDLGIDVDQSLVEEALANTFDEPVAAVRQAIERHGDIGIAAELTRRHALAGR